MSRFCHLDGALATRDLSHSVEKTWSVPRRFSLNVLRSTILFYRRGGVCPPLYSTAVFTLNTLDLCSFSSLYISTFCSQKVAKTSGTSWASRSRLLLVSYYVTSLIRFLLVARVLTFQSREQKNSLHALPISYGAHAQTLLFFFLYWNWHTLLLNTMPVLFWKLPLFAVMVVVGAGSACPILSPCFRVGIAIP